ncbi:MAG TPA: histidine phosphatase family protein [Planctomycetota bacterium]|jgi:probable phosphoglycerate mutase|nr:histidine phosphatase family protein [Planctomycetota bacterium]
MSHPHLWLARHGQTAWSLAGKHTGRSDIPLTPEGEDEARKLGARLQKTAFATVLTSPLQRARKTCELAGFGAAAEQVPDLMEWNYGAYDGLTSGEIRAKRPDWHLFRDGCPGGEQLADVAARADRVIARLRSSPGDALIFSHGHLLRVLAIRWAGIPGELGGRFSLAPASLSILGTDAASGDPVLERWNDVCHL